MSDTDFWDDNKRSAAQAEAIKAATARDKVRTVRRDTFDKVAWEHLLGNTPAIRQQVTGLEIDHETSPPAYEDLFNLLLQGSSLFESEDAMVDEYLPQHGLMTGIAEAEDFARLRRHTVYDQYKTTAALIALEEAFKQAFDELARHQEENPPFCPWPPPPPEDGGGQEQDESEPGDQPNDQPGDQPAPGAGDEPSDEPANDDGGLTEVPGHILDELVAALYETTKDLNAEDILMNTYGAEDGDLQRMSYAERRALADKLDSGKLKKLAELIGAFRMFGNAERRRKIKHAPGEVVDYYFGNDLTKLAPEELENMCIPELDDLFWIRYSQYALLLRETRGTAPADKGPIIVVCDESGTMGLTLDGVNTREAWSKAVSLALCDQAKRDKRDFTYIGFAGPGAQWRMDFPKGVAPITKVIEFVEHFFNGGTHYETPLRQAMDIVHESGKNKPDIVFISDDDCKVPAAFILEWNAMRERADARCYGIQIGGQPSGVMASLVDRSISLSKLNATPEGAKELFQTI